MSYLTTLKSFEEQLDAAFDQLPCWSYDGELSIVIAAQLIEQSFSKDDPNTAFQLRKGLSAILPRLIAQDEGADPDLEGLVKSLLFAGHYYNLREYLYYSYNAKTSCVWTFDGAKVGIRYNDRSLPRQFFVRDNNFFTGSMKLFEGYSAGEKIESLLRGTSEFAYTPQTAEAMALIEAEADIKLSAYFSIIDPSSPVPFGPYTYSEYYKLYRALVTKALYHRYHAKVNGVKPGHHCVFIGEIELAAAVAAELNLAPNVVQSMLNDATYSRAAVPKKIQPMHYPLIRLQRTGQYLLMPYDFSLGDGLVSILRVRASEDPEAYLQHVAPAIDKAFTETVARDFEKEGFICQKNVQLQDFDKSLPDIDLLVISLEPTLGFHIYVCELKAPIPAAWSKDNLRALAKDGVSKAFKQVGKIIDFLNTEVGFKFLRSLLPEEGIPHFGQEFLIVARAFVVTSDNAGMFFSDKDTAVVEYKTLRSILQMSDGDVTVINDVLHKFPSMVDDCFEPLEVSCSVGDLEVSYEKEAIRHFLTFPHIPYRSIGLDKGIAQNFIEDGHHPYDCLRERLEQHSLPKGEQVAEPPLEQSQGEKAAPGEEPMAGDGKLRARRPERLGDVGPSLRRL